MARQGTVKVRNLALEGDEFELRRDVARRSGVLKNLMDTKDGQGHQQQTLEIRHEKATRANVERCAIACSAETLQPRTVKDDEILEALVVADYLDMQPAIKNLCEWIAREIEQCASEELSTRFEMGEGLEKQEEPQQAQAAEMHPPGSLGCLPFDFWREHLFPILSNTKQESLQLACPGFQKLSEYPSHEKMRLYRDRDGPTILKELTELAGYMDRAADKQREIAEEFVAASREDPESYLHEIFGKVLNLEREFDWYESQDKRVGEYFEVINMIRDEGLEAGDQLGTEDEESMGENVHGRLTAFLEAARGCIQQNIKATEARLNRTRTYLLRIGFKAEDTFVESREIDELLNNVYPGSQPRTRSIKRQKTRGPGQPKHRQEDTEQRRKLLLRDLRTLPAGCPWSLVVRVEVRGASEESDGDSESEEQAGDYIAITPDVFRYEPCGHAMLECEYRLTTSAASAKIHLWNAGGSPVKMRVSSSSSSSSSGDYEMEKGKGTIIKHDCDEGGEWECADEDGIKWLRVRLIKA